MWVSISHIGQPDKVQRGHSKGCFLGQSPASVRDAFQEGLLDDDVNTCRILQTEAGETTNNGETTSNQHNQHNIIQRHRPNRDMTGPESSGGVGPESREVWGLNSLGFEGPVGLFGTKDRVNSSCRPVFRMLRRSQAPPRGP